MIDNFSGTNLDFSAPIKLLDFGCGVGKMLIGLRRFEKIQLHGCDLDSNLIDWCANNLNAQCYANGLYPPLAYPDNHFDAINAISVFTHLNLEMQFRWAWELFRVLKPGGFLHITIHGPAYMGLFAHCVKTRTVTDFKLHVFEDSEFFMELEQPIHNDLYVQKKGEKAQGQLEVAVAHTEQMIRKIFSPFSLQKVVVQGSIGGGHDAYVLKKINNSSRGLFDKIETIEKIQNGEGVLFRCQGLSAPDVSYMFRVFATAMPMGILETEVCAMYSIKENGKSIIEGRIVLTKGSRFFGEHYWLTVDIELPIGIDDLLIEIKSTPKLESYLQGVKWFAPQLIARTPDGK